MHQLNQEQPGFETMTFFLTPLHIQGCEWQIMKKEEKSRVAFRAVRFALKIAFFYDFGQYI